MDTKIDKVNHIVYVKKMRITGRSISYGFVKIDAEEQFRVVNDTLYTGFLVYPSEFNDCRANFFNSMIVKDFGDISIDEILEKYPEYLI